MQGETAVLGRRPSPRSPRRRCCTPRCGWPRSSAGCCVPGEGWELCTPQNQEDVPKVSRSCSQAGPCPATAQVCSAEASPSPAPLLPLFWLKSPKSIAWEQNGAAHASCAPAPGSQSRSRGSFQAGSSQNWLRRAAGRGKTLRREAFLLATRHLSPPQRGVQGPVRHHSPPRNKTSGVLHFGQAVRQKRSVTRPQQPSLWSW